MIAVLGSCNVSVTVPVDGFPVTYEPTRYLPGQITWRPSGVALNVAEGLALQGEDVRLYAPWAEDAPGMLVAEHCERWGIALQACARIPATARSVVLVAPDGTRMINTDLAGVLERPRREVTVPRFYRLAALAEALPALSDPLIARAYSARRR